MKCAQRTSVWDVLDVWIHLLERVRDPMDILTSNEVPYDWPEYCRPTAHPCRVSKMAFVSNCGSIGSASIASRQLVPISTNTSHLSMADS
ncbi:unnamed protein product [Medioppia subpectinata]|uniref:Uncharacterized protein n=1 Tax=Medioppia subpectinata TaxID=1979941 RepID=A0A7R9PUS4_9ACAR|nr:unnamed protein product [Medioppia subpectinata]CAG2102060.1 unnamed protein product [Medioppia subpectinata]